MYPLKQSKPINIDVFGKYLSYSVLEHIYQLYISNHTN